MYSARGDTALPVPGFPIRASAGQSLFSSSPRLIAAVHALLRLLVPRHPPCALTILTVIVDNNDARRRRGFSTVIFPLFAADVAPAAMAMLCSFQGPARAQPEGLSGWSLKTQQYAPALESTGSRLGRRSRCAAQAMRPGGRLSIESSLERR